MLHAAWATPALSLIRAGRHLPRPCGAEDRGDAHDSGMADGLGRTNGAVEDTGDAAPATR